MAVMAVTMAVMAVTMAVMAVTMAVMVVTMAVMVVTMEVTMAAMVDILNQTLLLIRINPPDLKAGKIEVMETLLKTLNMKVAEAGEKGDFRMRTMSQMIKISNPSLQV